ncbi:hypothetical protein GGF46_003530 [Coemansia sp. RSA 552]|nr:hypothetical protein GGF46_003530 [Coemansia sp. RSA 552]
MFQRARSNSITPLESQRHVAKDGNREAAEQLNRRVQGEVDQLLGSFGEIVQASRVYAGSGSMSRRIRRSGDDDDDDNSSDGYDSDDGAVQTGNSEPPKDKYMAAQEAYSAQTRAATMVRSVENLLGMVGDVRRAYLVNDTSALVAMAARRRQALELRTRETKAAIEALNATLDTAVRELEAVYYNSKYIE